MHKVLDRERAALLVLLRIGLWERGGEDLSCFPLSADGWERLFLLARQQTVTGIVFRGMQSLPDELLPSEDMLVRWMAAVDAIQRKNRRMNSVLVELYSKFRSAGVTPVLQKGQGVALFYEIPSLRECGDIDLYFKNSDAWNFALACVRRCNVNVRTQADRSIFYKWRNVEVEHHRQLLDLYNPFMQGYVDRVERDEGYRHVTLKAAGSARIVVPSPFLNILQQNLHILKHAMGRGVGLRQLCDMARACYRLHSEVDGGKMEEVCRRLGLYRWSGLLHAFLVSDLGLPASCLPFGCVASSSAPLSEIIWHGGNFGQHAPGRAVGRQSALSRKLHTAGSFFGNVRFSLRYAPKETFWVFCKLLKGQIK